MGQSERFPFLYDSRLVPVNETACPPPFPPPGFRLALLSPGLDQGFISLPFLVQETTGWFAENNVFCALPWLSSLNWSDALRSPGTERKAGGGKQPR